MDRALVVVLVVVGLAGAAYVGFTYFAPKGETRVDEALPDDASFVAVKEGAFRSGAPGHDVSGRVTLLRAADGSHLLRFEEYEATSGPDVYYYLTPTPRADSTASVEGAGLRVTVPGGDDGEATLRGDFNVPLPDGFDPSAYRGLSVWCERFNVLFGDAPFV